MRRARLGRAGAVIAVVVSAGVLLSAQPAAAHVVTGVSPTNYRSRIVGVTPALADVEVKLLDLGRRVELTNRGDADVIVLGYEGEPYLRVGPTGVYENDLSPTVEENQEGSESSIATTRMTLGEGSPGGVAPPPTGPPPDWEKVSSGQTARWRDHRTRWEGADPPQVEADPDRAHIVSQWNIQLRRGDTASVVRGLITWIPGPNPLPWWLLALGLTVATVASALSSRWGWWLSAAAALMVAADIGNAFAAAAANDPPLSDLLLTVFLGGFITTAAWVVGVLAVGPLQRQRSTGLFAAGLASLMMVLYTLPEALGLGRSQIPTAAPFGLARAATATVLGIGLGLIIAVVVVFRRHPELLPSPTETGGDDVSPNGS